MVNVTALPNFPNLQMEKIKKKNVFMLRQNVL